MKPVPLDIALRPSTAEDLVPTMIGHSSAHILQDRNLQQQVEVTFVGPARPRLVGAFLFRNVPEPRPLGRGKPELHSVPIGFAIDPPDLTITIL
jgi:hypothetical protein